MYDTKVQQQVFAGNVMIGIRSEPAKMGSIVTAYVNGISLRAPSTVLAEPRIRDRFLDSVLVAAYCCNDADEQRALGKLESFILDAIR